jgi:hypothetical protein
MRPLARLVLCCGVAASALTAQAPVNDDPAGAVAISLGVNPGAPAGVSGSYFTNVNATNSAGYTAVCGSGANSDVFFSYAAASTGVHVFALCPPAGFLPGSFGDGILNVYDAASPTVSLACDDNGCAINAPGNVSNLPQVAVTLAAGASYLVRVSVSGVNATGEFYVSVTSPTEQGGETCATSPVIGEGVHGGNFVAVTASAVTYAGCSTFTAVTPDLYYDFTPAVAGSLVVQREGGPANRIAVSTGACGSEVLVAGTCTTLNYVVFTVAAGTTYHLRFGANSASATALAGAFLFSLRVMQPTSADGCATAIALGPGDNAATSIGATADGTITACAGFASSLVLDSWATLTTTGAGQLTVRVLAVNAPQCAVYVGGACGSLGTSTCALNSTVGLSVTVTVTAGQQIFVRAGHASAPNASSFNIRTEFASAATNDDCPTASPVVLGPNGPFSNSGASDGSIVASCATSFRDVWHSWVAPQTGLVRMSGCNSGSDAVFAVFSSCGGAEIACDDNDLLDLGPCATAQPTAPYVEFEATAGSTYYLRVAPKTAVTLTYFVDVAYRFSLVITSNVGAGTVNITDLAGPPNMVVANVITFFAGLYPNGWLYGVDIPFSELAMIAAAGDPFIVTLDGNGFKSLTYAGVPLPLNVTAYSVGVAFNAFGFPTSHTRSSATSL